MKTPKRLHELLSEIAGQFPEAIIKFKPLPSGFCRLDVWYGRRNFELEYSPSQGVGVSENFDDTVPFVGADSAFESLAEGADHLKSLLGDAARTEADHLAKDLVLHDAGSNLKNNL